MWSLEEAANTNSWSWSARSKELGHHQGPHEKLVEPEAMSDKMPPPSQVHLSPLSPPQPCSSFFLFWTHGARGRASSSREQSLISSFCFFYLKAKGCHQARWLSSLGFSIPISKMDLTPASLSPSKIGLLDKACAQLCPNSWANLDPTFRQLPHITTHSRDYQHVADAMWRVVGLEVIKQTSNI